MSEFRKGRLALALAVLAIAAIMLGVTVQTEDSQADDVQPRTDLTNLESITVVLNDGTALYNSNTYNDLKVGNSDDSEALITVMGQFNENGSMITRELEPGDYEFQGHSLSDRLDRGSYEITIVAGIKTAQLSVNVLEDVIQELSITENGRIYAGTSDDELRDILVVTGVFEHIGVDNDPINYDVEWSKEAGQNVQFDFSATFNNRVVQQEAHFTVYEKKIESIKVESNGTLPKVFSGTDLNTLKDHFTVTATYEDGNSGELNNDEFQISGDIFVPSSPAGEEPIKESKILTFSVTNNPDVLPQTYTVEVEGEEVPYWYASLDDISFTAKDTIEDVRNALHIYITTATARAPVEISNTHCSVRIGEPESGVEELPEDDTRNLSVGDTILTVYFDDGLGVESFTLDINVDYYLVVPPSFSTFDTNYTGMDQREVSGYDDSLMKFTNISEGLTLNESGANPIFSTNAAGVYSFSVQLKDTDNCRWYLGRDVEPSLEPQVYEWEILKANIDSIVPIIEDGGWIYDPDIDPNDMVDLDVKVTGPQWTESDEASVVLEYYGVLNDDTTSVGSMQNPLKLSEVVGTLDSGTWYVRAHVDGTDGNWGEYTGDFVSFNISKATISEDAVVIGSRTYNGAIQTAPVTISEDYKSILSVGDSQGKDVDTYSVDITINKDNLNNYCWANHAGETKPFPWKIEKLGVEVPYLVYQNQSGNSVSIPYSDEQTSVEINYETWVEIDELPEGLTISGSNVQFISLIVGSYNLTVQLSDTDNLKWNETSDDTSKKTLTISIIQAENKIESVSMDGWVYDQWSGKKPSIAGALFGADTAKYSFAKGSADSNPQDLSYGIEYDVDHIDNNTLPSNAGGYWVKAHIPGTNNYGEAYAYKYFEISKAQLPDFNLTIDDWIYKEMVKDPSVDEVPGFENVEYAYAIRAEGETDGSKASPYLSDVPEDAGLYWVRAYIPESQNYEEGYDYYGFEIQRKPIDVPTYSGKHVYNHGEDIKIGLTSTDEYTVSGDTIVTGAGQYHATVTPTKNYCWNDGQSNPNGNRTVDWTVEKFTVVPELERSVEYESSDGWSWSPKDTIEAYAHYEDGTNTPIEFSISDNPQSAIGDYKIAITMDPEFFENYQWGPGENGVGDQGEPLTDMVSGDDIELWFRITKTSYDLQIHEDLGEWTFYDNVGNKFTPHELITKECWDSLDDEIKEKLNGKMGVDWGLHFYDSEGKPVELEKYGVMGLGVGEYKVDLYILATGTFASNQSGQASFEVTKATISVEENVEGTVKYDGTEHDVATVLNSILNPSAQNGYPDFSSNVKIEWSLDGVDYSDTVSIRDVYFDGEVKGHTVHYRVSADNFKTVLGTASFKVTQAQISIDILDQFPVYTGEVAELSSELGIGYTLVGNPFGNEDLGISLTTNGVDVNTEGYEILWDPTNTNYDVSIADEGRCYIQNAEMDVGSVSVDGWQYDGVGKDMADMANPTIVLKGDDNEPTILFSTDPSEDRTYSQNLLLKDVDEYTVYYIVEAPNHNTSEPQSFTVTITKAYLTVTADDKTITYGDNEPDYTISYEGFKEPDNESLFAATLEATCSYVKGNDAGLYQIGFDYEPELDNYDIIYVSGTLTVNKFEISLSFDNITRDYENRLNHTSGIPMEIGDETVWSYLPTILPDEIDDILRVGVVIGDECTLNLPDSVTPVGGYQFGYVFQDDMEKNYTVTISKSASYIIQKSTITVIVSMPDSTYDGSAKTATVEANGVEVSYQVSSGGAWTDIDNDNMYGPENDNLPVNAGKYRVVVTPIDKINYDVSQTNVEFKISKARIDMDVTLSDPYSEYDGQAHHPIVEGTIQDGKDGSKVTLTYSTDPINASSERYQVTVTFHSNSSNYEDEVRTGYVTIVKREVEVVWTIPEQIYGSSDSSAIRAVYEDINDSEIDLVVHLDEGQQFVNAGDYSFTASFDPEDSGSSNYSLTGSSTTVKIQKKPVTLSIQNASKAYLAEVPEIVIGGIEDIEDDLHEYIDWRSVSGTLNADSAVSKYTLELVYDGSKFSNYEITPIYGTLEITPLEISVEITGGSYPYTGFNQTIYPTDGVARATYEVSIVDGQDVSATDEMLNKIMYQLNARLSFNEEGSDNDWRIDVGEYEIHLQNPNKNFEIVSETVGKYIITAVDMAYDYEDSYTHEYIGSAQMPFVPSVKDITFVGGKDVSDSVRWYYRSSESEEWHEFTTDSLPSFTHVKDSGTKYYKIEADNHNPYVFDIEVNITKADNALLSYERDDWIYKDTPSETEYQLKFTTENVEPTFYYSKDGGEYSSGEPTLAGAYHVKFTYPASDDFNGLEVEFDEDMEILRELAFVIEQKPIDIPSWNAASFPYNGEDHGNTLIFDSTIVGHVSSGTTADENLRVDISSSEGNTVITMTGNLSGDYYSTIEIIDANYRWSDGDASIQRIVHWSISSNENGWNVNLTIKGWDYGQYTETINTPTAVSDYGTVIFRYYYSDGTPILDPKPEQFDAGTYYVTASVDPTPSYTGLDPVRVDFTVSKAKITVPVNQVSIYDPNEELQHFPLTSFGAGVDVDVENGVHNGAGTYEVKLIIEDPNHEWSSGDTTATVSWTIERKEVPKPTEDNPGTDNVFVYAENTTHTYIPDITEGYEDYIALEGHNASNAGEYILKASLDFSNFRWSGEANDAESAPVELKWTISSRLVDAPYLSDETSGYTGDTIENQLHNYNRAIMWLDHFDTALKNTDEGPMLVAVDPGVYEIHIIIWNVNYGWDESSLKDGAILKDGTLILTWSIDGAAIDWPESWPGNGYVYNGGEQRFDFGTFPTNLVDITGDVATDAGTHTICVTPKEGYEWSNGGNETREIQWTIAQIEITIVADDVEVEYGEEPVFSWSYQGDGRFVVSDGIVPTLRVDGEHSSPGAYDILFDEIDNGNYDIEYIKGTLTVTKAVVEIPDEGMVKFTGEPIGAPFQNPLYTVESEPQTEVGEYTATLTLKEPANYAWEGTDSASVTVVWRIVGGEVISWEDFNEGDLTGDEIYTGHEIVKDVRSSLRENVDYIVLYEDNTDVGTATGTIRGIGGYSGSITFEFEITKATAIVDFEEVTVNRYSSDEPFRVIPNVSDFVEEVVYSSSDTDVATVDANGRVTMVGTGTTVITATVLDADNYVGASDSYTLNVSSTPSGGGSHTVVVYDNSVVTFETDRGLTYDILTSGSRSISFTVSVLDGFGIDPSTVSVTANGVELVPTDGVYTLSNIRTDVLVSITCEGGYGEGEYAVTYYLSNSSIDVSEHPSDGGESFRATVSSDFGWSGLRVTVLMGGVDVTSEVVSGDVIEIDVLTGDVVVIAESTFPWIYLVAVVLIVAVILAAWYVQHRRSQS